MNEDNVIDGVINYLKDKNRKRDGFKVQRANAKDGDHGIDIKAQATLEILCQIGTISKLRAH